MKFATILREAGICERHFPISSEIEIRLFDGDDEFETQEDVHYNEPLFVNNNDSYNKFFDLADKLDFDPVMSMDIKIDKNYVIVFYGTPEQIAFRRANSMQPLDYME